MEWFERDIFDFDRSGEVDLNDFYIFRAIVEPSLRAEEDEEACDEEDT
ncbi:MAG: hypothetical protein IIY16_00935 [Oscillospiraceae bacterium]|nr:hypothetical protein [Oscillospiraceae bacterium]